MLKISKPLSVGTTKSYYKEEYTKAENASYYTQQGELQGQWHGRLAEDFGLKGTVTEAEYDRLVNGQHPHTAEQLIQHRDTVKTASGEEVAHRAAWDFTFGAPKSVSITALVGGDDRVREAHREAVKTALDATEKYVQARMGGDNPAQTTGNWAAALFEHDTARPVAGGPPDPHLHTHAVVFNMTRDEEGQHRSLQTAELFRIQAYSTSVYQSELAMRLHQLGYKLTLGEGYAPEIKAYTKEYLDSASQRRDEIKARMDELGISGAEAGERIAKQTRANKQVWDPAELREEHLDHAQNFGNQPAQAIFAAAQLGPQVVPGTLRETKLDEAITHARDRLSERSAVFDRYELLRDSLRTGQSHFTLADAERALDRRIEKGEFLAIDHYRSNAPGARYTTPETLRMERDTIEYVHSGKATVEPLHRAFSDQTLSKSYPTLNKDQGAMVREVIASPDRVQAVQGGAGTGKTYALSIVQDIAKEQGYEVKGLAPTSQAANNLKKDGIEAETIQAHLTRGSSAEGLAKSPASEAKRTLFLLDESSLASTKQVHDFLHRLGPQDRVVLVGDTRQHQSVEAGRIFEELQQAGMRTSRLDEIIRQKNPELKAAVQDLARGDIKGGLNKLNEQDRVREIENRTKRFEAISLEYAKNPQTTLVISPDNASRQDLNRIIREQLQEQGSVAKEAFVQPVLVNRQDVTGADRKRAESYRPGDIVRFERDSKTLEIEKKTYATVVQNSRDTNQITIQLADGREKTYDPKRFYGVQLYRMEHRQFSVGDRVQFTAPWKDQGVVTRELGTIAALDKEGNAAVRLDNSNRTIGFNLNRMGHIDHGYAVTSYSSQGLTVDNTILQIDTRDPQARGLLGRELAYVALSRARHDVQIFTDSAERLGVSLDRTHEAGKALSPDQIKAYRYEEAPQKEEQSERTSKRQEKEQEHSYSYGISI
ncbi:MAG: MobF family relaxase [Bryobacteraceae bacterium]